MTTMPDSWSTVKRIDNTIEDVIFIDGKKMHSFDQAAYYVLHQLWDGQDASYVKAHFDALKYLLLIKQ